MYSRINKKYWIVLILIITIASAIRLYNPTFRSIWGDEAHSIYLSSQPIIAIVDNAVKDSHMPAYFMLLSAWTNIFGVFEYDLRLLSIIIGILAVIVLFFFIKDLFDEKAALIAASLMGFSPLAIMHSQEIRVYGLVLLMSILSSWFLWRLLNNKINIMTLLSYVFFTFALGMAHIYASLLIIAQAIYLIYCYFSQKDLRPFFVVFVAQMVAIALILPFYIRLFILNYAASMSNNADLAFSVFPIYLKPFLFFFVLTLGETVAPWNLGIVIPAIVLFTYILFSPVKYYKEKAMVYMLVLCLVPICIASCLKPTMPKYLIISLPYYLGIMGYLIYIKKNALIRYLLLIICLGLFSLSIINYYSRVEYHNSNQIEPWKEIAKQIKANYKAGDRVVASNKYISYRILNYYLNTIGHNNFNLSFLAKNLDISKAKRLWYVSHIVDERAMTPHDVRLIKSIFGHKYRLISEESFVPYSETLVSKLPINRHKPGSFRIVIKLYEEN